MRRHGNLLGGRCLGEKRRKRWKRCKEWRCEKRQWAFYKERTSRRSASLASPSAPSAPSAPHARRTHDDGFLPSGLRPIDTLLLLPGLSPSSSLNVYIYTMSLYVPLAAPRQLYSAKALTEKPTLPPLPLYGVNDFFNSPPGDPGFTDFGVCENAVV